MKKTSRKINVIIIAGVSGSGKTTLVNQIKNNQINKNIKNKIQNVNTNHKTQYMYDLYPNTKIKTKIKTKTKTEAETVVIHYDLTGYILRPKFNTMWPPKNINQIINVFHNDPRLKFLNQKNLNVYVININSNPNQIIKQYKQRYTEIYMPDRNIIRNIYTFYVKPILTKIKIITKHNRAIRKENLYQNHKLIDIVQEAWIQFLKQKNKEGKIQKIICVKANPKNTKNKTFEYTKTI